jgi:hypothetical protein
LCLVGDGVAGAVVAQAQQPGRITLPTVVVRQSGIDIYLTLVK